MFQHIINFLCLFDFLFALIEIMLQISDFILENSIAASFKLHSVNININTSMMTGYDIVIISLKVIQLMDKTSVLHKRKFIESEVDVKEMIVIDNGTQSVKVGRSGQDYPSLIIPTVAGVPRVISQNDATPPKRVYFGKELAGIIDAKKYTVEFSYPIEESRIGERSFEDMVNLWGYALEVLGAESKDCDVLIIDSPANPKDYKAKILTLMAEKLKIGSVLFMNSSSLSLFSVGATIGLVTEMGHGSTTCVPVYEGFLLGHALEKSTVAGKQITRRLEEQLKGSEIAVRGKDMLDYAEVIGKVKEKNVRVAYDYHHQLLSDDRTLEQRSFELPDGNVVQFSKTNVFQPAEVMFEGHGLPQMLTTSLERCSEEIKGEVMKNAIFCGGSSMLPGLEERMHKELSTYGQQLNLTFDWQRRYSAWIGGSMVGSLSTFQQLAIPSKDISYSDILRRIL